MARGSAERMRWGVMRYASVGSHIRVRVQRENGKRKLQIGREKVGKVGGRVAATGRRVSN